MIPEVPRFFGAVVIEFCGWTASGTVGSGQRQKQLWDFL